MGLEEAALSSMGPARTVLVVDDEPDVRALYEQWFRSEVNGGRYEFHFFLDGTEALEAFARLPQVDVVLSDIRMPILDGLTLLAQIQEIDPLTLTVMVSAYGDMDNIRAAMNRGAFDFLTKPLDRNDLRATLERAAESASQRRAAARTLRDNRLFKKVVSEGMVERVDAESLSVDVLACEQVEGSVLFVDLVGFTGFAEQVDPSTVVEHLNRTFDVLVPEIRGFGGVVDKFMGDSVMALFRGPSHLERALDSGLAMVQRTDRLAARASAGGRWFPRVTVGVHSGPMISGPVGSRELDRFDFTVIGDVVNTASRLQGAASAGQLVVLSSVFDPLAGQFEGDRLGSVQLRNKAAATELVSVIGRR